jgi:hypothetical protein
MSNFIPNPHLRGTNPVDALRLIRSEQVGPMTFFRLVKFCGSVEKALEMAPTISKRGGRAKPIKIASKADAEREYEALTKFGAEVVMYGQERHPSSPCAGTRICAATPTWLAWWARATLRRTAACLPRNWRAI